MELPVPVSNPPLAGVKERSRARSRLLRICTVALAVAVAATCVTAVRPPQTAAASGSNIAALAYANLSKHACDRNSLGGTGFSANGYSSCTYSGGWCWIFADWVWANNGVNVAGLTSPAAFEHYRHAMTGTPHVGDVVVFNQNGGAGHVAIVYSVNTWANPETVTTVGGNESFVWVWLRTFPAAVGSYSGSSPAGYVAGYVTP